VLSVASAPKMLLLSLKQYFRVVVVTLPDVAVVRLGPEVNNAAKGWVAGSTSWQACACAPVNSRTSTQTSSSNLEPSRILVQIWLALASHSAVSAHYKCIEGIIHLGLNDERGRAQVRMQF